MLMARYFKDIWAGVTTILIGMSVTFRHLFDRAVTVQYPHQTLEMNERTRARLVNHADKCSYCLSCQRICPTDCFTIVGVRAEKGEDLGMLPTGKPKKMHVVQFDIDFNKCLYCGLCVDVCETGSLHWESPQEESVYTREGMVKKFATYPPEEVKRLQAREEERKKAKAAAAAAKGKVPGKPGIKPGIKGQGAETSPTPGKEG